MATEKAKGPSDPWQSEKTNWEYIEIPTENALGYAHDTFSLNKHTFEPGQRYLVPPQIAATLRERLRVYARACVRTLQPNRDMVAENAVSVGSASAARHVDPATIGA